MYQFLHLRDNKLSHLDNFLEARYGIKKEDLAEAEFVRAKKLFYTKQKKPKSLHTRSQNSSISAKPERQSRPLLLSPIATPSREVSPSVSFHLPQNFVGGSSSKPEHPKILSPYKQFHKQIEKELTSQPLRSSHGVLKYFLFLKVFFHSNFPQGDNHRRSILPSTTKKYL